MNHTPSTQTQPRNFRPSSVVQPSPVAWAMAHMDVMDWIEVNMASEFGASLMAGLDRYGSLTERQTAAVRSKIEAAKVQVLAPALTVERIEQAFNEAKDNGVKRPRMNLDTFTFKPAGEKSANAGALYVTEEGEYLGKVMGGRFLKVSACSDDQQARIVVAASDPAAAAHAYGQRTGRCSICSRELTAEESIERSIGPICAGKYGL